VSGSSRPLFNDLLNVERDGVAAFPREEEMDAPCRFVTENMNISDVLSSLDAMLGVSSDNNGAEPPRYCDCRELVLHGKRVPAPKFHCFLSDSITLPQTGQMR
jgi:hypothetical protein